MIEWLKGVSGFLALMGLWVAVQAVLRRGYGAPADTDMLEHAAHGCGGCGHDCTRTSPLEPCPRDLVPREPEMAPRQHGGSHEPR